MFDLSIIIVNFQSRKFLAPCIASIKDVIKDASYEVVVVNNDQTVTLPEKEFPGVRIVQNSKNLGFGTGCNIGAKYASGEILFFLNPDTKIMSGRFLKIKEKFGDGDIGIIGSKLVDSSLRAQPWNAGSELDLWELIKNNLGISSSRLVGKVDKDLSVGWTSAAAFFIPRKLFGDLGGFDPGFFMYLEDVDLCRRVRQAGKKIHYSPSVIVVHEGGASYAGSRNQKKNYFDSLEYYFKKHQGPFQWRLVKMARRLLFK